MDCVNKHGILLQVVQVLTDLNLFIRKAYITSDGSWFMDGKHLLFDTHSIRLKPFESVETEDLSPFCAEFLTLFLVFLSVLCD